MYLFNSHLLFMCLNWLWKPSEALFINLFRIVSLFIIRMLVLSSVLDKINGKPRPPSLPPNPFFPSHSHRFILDLEGGGGGGEDQVCFSILFCLRSVLDKINGKPRPPSHQIKGGKIRIFALHVALSLIWGGRGDGSSILFSPGWYIASSGVGGYSTKLYVGKLCPETQPLTFLYTISERNGTPFIDINSSISPFRSFADGKTDYPTPLYTCWSLKKVPLLGGASLYGPLQGVRSPSNRLLTPDWLLREYTVLK